MVNATFLEGKDNIEAPRLLFESLREKHRREVPREVDSPFKAYFKSPPAGIAGRIRRFHG